MSKCSNIQLCKLEGEIFREEGNLYTIDVIVKEVLSFYEHNQHEIYFHILKKKYNSEIREFLVENNIITQNIKEIPCDILNILKLHSFSFK